MIEFSSYETLPDWPFGVIPLDDDDEEDSSLKATVSVLVLICISLFY